MWKKLIQAVRSIWPFGKDPALWDDKELAREYVEAAGRFGRLDNSTCPEDYGPFHKRWSRWRDLEREWALRGYKPVAFKTLMERYNNGEALWPVVLEENEDVIFFAPESHDKFVSKSTRLSLPN
ncbi:MAG: hypothetical protein WA001_03870 [Patescibacteria group bacterium]